MDGLEGFQRNWIGLFKALPAYYKPARFWREDGVAIGITRLPLEAFNGAVFEENCQLSPGHLTRLEALFEAEGVAFSVQLFSRQSTYPDHAWMIQHGYVELFTDPLMIYDSGLLPAFPGSAGLEVHQLTGNDPAEFVEYRDIYAAGFGLPPSLEDFYHTFANMRENRRIIARLNGKPVGSGLLMCFDGTAGIYNLTTLHNVRRQGIGTAMMVALHNLALQEGYTATVLASSAMGMPLYKALGYRLDGYQHVYIPRRQMESFGESLF